MVRLLIYINRLISYQKDRRRRRRRRRRGRRRRRHILNSLFFTALLFRNQPFSYRNVRIYVTSTEMLASSQLRSKDGSERKQVVAVFWRS
jgi:hypothetical protein